LNLATVGIIDDDPTNPSTVGLIQEIEQELDMSGIKNERMDKRKNDIFTPCC